jgi:diaminopimelate epimerase
MPRRIEFAKMCGAGNDFVVLDETGASRLEGRRTEWVRDVCRRRYAIGADGVLFVRPLAGGHVGVEFLNPDGSPAFCGNGSRCAARYAVLRGLATSPFRLETAAGVLPAEVDGERVALTLPLPVGPTSVRLQTDAGPISGARVVAGVPHLLIDVERVDEAPLSSWGPLLRRHAEFGDAGTNVDVIGNADDGELPIRTWERGVEGETLACGSGALAAGFLEWRRHGRRRTTVLPASGVPIEIEFRDAGTGSDRAVMTGDARLVYEGVWADEGG